MGHLPTPGLGESTETTCTNTVPLRLLVWYTDTDPQSHQEEFTSQTVGKSTMYLADLSEPMIFQQTMCVYLQFHGSKN